MQTTGIKVKEILREFFPAEKIDFDDNPEKTVALGATYLAYLKANPRLSIVKKQLQFKQMYEYVQTDETYPFLFAFSGSKKWKDTIIKVDRNDLATHKIVDRSIDLARCDLIQVRDSIYAVNANESFTRYKVCHDNTIEMTDLKP